MYVKILIKQYLEVGVIELTPFKQKVSCSAHTILIVYSPGNASDCHRPLDITSLCSFVNIKMSEEEPIRPSSQNFLLNKNALIQLQVRFIKRWCIVERLRVIKS